MTNEEAITRIKMMLNLSGFKYKPDIEALLMAKKALKNELFLTDALHKAYEEIKEMDKRIEELKQEDPDD